MDINTLRILATLASFGTFLGIVYWTYVLANRQRLDEAARIPFEQD